MMAIVRRLATRSAEASDAELIAFAYRARHRHAHHGFIADEAVGTYDVTGHSVPTVRYTLRR
jgi:hypothetical protein